MTVKDRVISILVERDGMSYEDAEELIDEALEDCQEAIHSGDSDPKEIWRNATGLEPDYLMEILL